MLQWMVYPAGWTLPFCGAIVGYVTNWIALKWIFEPLVPTKIIGGPFPIILHGMFLQRQRDVSRDFSTYIAAKVLTSQQVWQAILAEGTPQAAEFARILRRNLPWWTPSAIFANLLKAMREQVGRPLVVGGSHPLHAYSDLVLGNLLFYF